MRIFNTLTRKREEFKPLKEGEVKMYACGPTVYNFAHIGNFRAYIFYDLITKYLKYLGYKVTVVSNITDVDDKTIKASQKEGIKLSELTERYTKSFFEDLNTLNIDKADIITKATEHIKEMLSLVKILTDKGIAYKGEDGSIYFSVSKFKEYGKLSHFDITQLKAGASGRVSADEYSKDAASDFALWKAWTEEDGDVFWESEFGKGRPGWHLECSAMSMKHLGETFDLHLGGIDLMFPHHENEIAQSEGATGKPFAKYWMHNEHLLVDGKKMSKSLGNFYTLRDVLEKGHKPEAVRYLFLSGHYKDQINFTFKSLEAAQSTVNRIFDFVRTLKSIKSDGGHEDIDGIIATFKRDFEMAMDNDLNTPVALAKFFDFIKEINKHIEGELLGTHNAKSVLEIVEKVDSVLGLLKYMEKELPISEDELKQLIEDREIARTTKNFEKADEIRDSLAEKGIILEDSKDGPKWKVV